MSADYQRNIMSTTPAPSVTRTVGSTEVPVPGSYTLDASHTHVGFTVRHLAVSKVRGQFGTFSGDVVIAEDPAESSVKVTVDLTSIDTNDEGRDAHLRSADFFNTDSNASMVFESTAVRASGDHWDVDGDLTLNGVTKQLTLAVEFEGATIDPWNNIRLGFSATGELNRDDYGVSWSQALETGGLVVGKTVKLAIDAEAIAPQA